MPCSYCYTCGEELAGGTVYEGHYCSELCLTRTQLLRGIPASQRKELQVKTGNDQAIESIVAAIEAKGYLVDLKHEPAYTGEVKAMRGARSCLLPARWLAVASHNPPKRSLALPAGEGLTILEALEALRGIVEASGG